MVVTPAASVKPKNDALRINRRGEDARGEGKRRGCNASQMRPMRRRVRVRSGTSIRASSVDLVVSETRMPESSMNPPRRQARTSWKRTTRSERNAVVRLTPLRGRTDSAVAMAGAGDGAAAAASGRSWREPDQPEAMNGPAAAHAVSKARPKGGGCAPPYRQR